MKIDDTIPEQTRSADEDVVKKHYESPALRVYGKLSQLTRSGAGSLGDQGTGKRPRA